MWQLSVWTSHNQSNIEITVFDRLSTMAIASWGTSLTSPTNRLSDNSPMWNRWGSPSGIHLLVHCLQYLTISIWMEFPLLRWARNGPVTGHCRCRPPILGPGHCGHGRTYPKYWAEFSWCFLFEQGNAGSCLMNVDGWWSQFCKHTWVILSLYNPRRGHGHIYTPWTRVSQIWSDQTGNHEYGTPRPKN